jgi:hypothetical protein
MRVALANVALAAAVACLASGCSADFPAVHDMPAPRAEATMTPDQIKQTTDSLICERENLAVEAQANAQAANQPAGPPAPPPPQKPCGPPATTGTIPAQPASAYARP